MIIYVINIIKILNWVVLYLDCLNFGQIPNQFEFKLKKLNPNPN